MISGQQIVYIGNAWFTENKTSSHHIAEVLSKNNTLLYIEAAGQRAPKSSKRDIYKIFKKIRNGFKKPFKVQPNIYLYSPIIIPFHKYSFIKRINKFILKKSITKACANTGFNRPLLWILLPHFSSIVGKLNEKGVIYYCVDEYSAQPNVDRTMIKESEMYLLERANVVFTVSEKLLENKIKMNPNTYLSLHGVDTNHFLPIESNSNIEVPQDIATISNPIAGFFGLIQERIDLKLIKYLAETLCDVSFVFIGLVSQDISIFKKNKNVYFLGPKTYDELPQYLNCFSVSLMPYKLNDEMINSNPKKLREYLASGKPVVSVKIKEVERYGELVYVANDYNEFLQKIRIAINENDSDLVLKRISTMQKESWEYRVDVISKIVTKHVPV